MELAGWRVFSVLALVVCLAAIAVQVGAPWGLHFGGSLGPVGDSLFSALETDIVRFALPAAYFRLAVPASAVESRAGGIAAAVVVGGAALANLRLHRDGRMESYALLFGVLVASYIFASDLVQQRALAALAACAAGAAVAGIVAQGWALPATVGLVGLATAYGGSFLFQRFRTRARLPESGIFHAGFILACFALGLVFVPPLVLRIATFLLPINELTEAYELVATFVGREKLDSLTLEVLIVTAFCQVSLGYLGIWLLRQGQGRKNALITVGEGKLAARGYARLVGIYMTTVALPYMLQRTVVESVNDYVFGHTAREVERSIRISSLFPQSPEGHGDMFLAAIHGSKYTVESYTDAFNSIVQVMYSAIELKLFTLPKLMLLPGMLFSQPWLVISVLPASMALDVGRSRMITMLTKRIEVMARHIQELASRRRKIEQHDAKHEELIRRGASTGFAETGWRQLAVEIEGASLRYNALTSLRVFINALYKQDVLGPGIELVLAWLLECKQITNSDIWVYTRVVEDTIDFLLTRFRMDATLASLRTNMDRVRDLSTRIAQVRARGHATCAVEPTGQKIHIAGLRYTRGPSEVELPQLVLRAGRVYAVTGANGSGKSSLFGVLASCGRHATMLPAGLEIKALDSLVLPSDDIVEITQQLYCPLYVTPFEWLLQRRDTDDIPQEEVQRSEEQITRLTTELQFRSKDDHLAKGEIGLTQAELHEEMEDWYGALSGGQRGKVEFIRKVFLRERCPGVLLIDEAFAPLDPNSKMLVQRKLKEFCTDSVVLVIYHGGSRETCVTAEGFFDEALHFGNSTASLTATC